MTTIQTFTKEVTYEFEFNGVTKTIDMYIDDLTKRRYISPTSYTQLHQYIATDFIGTEEPYQTISAEYLYELPFYDFASEGNVWLVTYKLPDVNKQVVFQFWDLDSEGNSIIHGGFQAILPSI